MSIIDSIKFNPRAASLNIDLSRYGYVAGDVVYVSLKGDFDPDGRGSLPDATRNVNFVYGDLDIPMSGRDYVRIVLNEDLRVRLVNNDTTRNDNTDPDQDFHIELAPGLFSGHGNRVFFADLTEKQADAIARGEPFMDALEGDDNIILPDRAHATIGTVRWNPNIVFKANDGNDTVSGLNFADRISGGDGDDTLLGGLGNDLLYGDAGTDRMAGGGGNDQLRGGTGGDRLHGERGNDVLYSDAGHETLEGGAGRDIFVFSEIKLTGAAPVDTIIDFTSGQDHISVRPIDAHGLPADGNSSFTFIGSQRFHEIPGELRAANGVVAGDVDGDGRAEFFIRVINRPAPTEADFFL